MTNTERKCQISIVIPLYNKEGTIRNTLKSVLSQDFEDYEIVVVNDGSTDQSLKRVKEIKSERISIYSKSNGGSASARNMGIRNANGKWVMILDADDLLVPGVLSHFSELTQVHLDCQFFSGPFFLKQGDNLFPCSQRYSEGVLKNNFKAWCTGHFLPVAGSCIILKELLIQYPFQENLRRYEDAESLFGIMRHARIWTTLHPTMIYNQDSCSASLARADISEDFIGHLSLEGKSMWEQYALWQLYCQGLELYPNDMGRLYKSKGFNSIKFKVLDFLAKKIYR